MDVDRRDDEDDPEAARAAPDAAVGVGWWRRRNLTLPAVAKQEM